MGSGGRSKTSTSFHYLNAQKRILREYARTHLTLGVHWRQSLNGVKSARGVKLEVTPSSEWTQDELDILYEVWGLHRPTPTELRSKTCVSLLFAGKSIASSSSSSSSASDDLRQRSTSCSSLSTLSFSGSEESDDAASSVDGGEATAMHMLCSKQQGGGRKSIKRKANQAELDQEILDSRTVTIEELREEMAFELPPFLGIGEPIVFPAYEALFC